MFLPNYEHIKQIDYIEHVNGLAKEHQPFLEVLILEKLQRSLINLQKSFLEEFYRFIRQIKYMAVLAE